MRRLETIVSQAVILICIIKIEPLALLDGGSFLEEIPIPKKQFHLCIQKRHRTFQNKKGSFRH